MRLPVPAIRWPGIRAGGVFAFILSWDEIVVTLYIAKFRILTLPRRMRDRFRALTGSVVAAAAVVPIAVPTRAHGRSVLLAGRGTAASDT